MSNYILFLFLSKLATVKIICYGGLQLTVSLPLPLGTLPGHVSWKLSRPWRGDCCDHLHRGFRKTGHRSSKPRPQSKQAYRHEKSSMHHSNWTVCFLWKYEFSTIDGFLKTLTFFLFLFIVLFLYEFQNASDIPIEKKKHLKNTAYARSCQCLHLKDYFFFKEVSTIYWGRYRSCAVSFPKSFGSSFSTFYFFLNAKGNVFDMC